MDLEQIEDALAEALPLRSPRFPPGTSNRDKTSGLEEHMLRSAHVNGNLVEARHWLRLLEASLTDQWSRLQGWEVGITKPRAKLTAEDIRQAKIQVAPQIHEARQKAVHLIASVEDQITRLEREERVCSRVWGMLG